MRQGYQPETKCARDGRATIHLSESPHRFPPRRTERIDIRELMKQEALAGPGDGCDDTTEKTRPGSCDIFGVSDQYLILDTFHKVESSNIARGEFRWNFMVQGSTGDSVIGVRDKIDTVTEVQLGPFSMPILPEVPYVTLAAAPIPDGRLILQRNNASPGGGAPALTPTAQYPVSALGAGSTIATPWPHNPYSQTPYFGQFTIQLQEAGLQSYSDAAGARHHFDCRLKHSGPRSHPQMLEARPLRGWETFVFTDPLMDVHGLTLIFRGTDAPLKFLPDVLYAVDFTIVAGFVMATATAHGLAMGDRVFVDGFSSGNLVLDAYMNRADGHVAAGDPSMPPPQPGTPLAASGWANVFWLDPAVGVASLAPAPAATTANVRIAARRMRIPIRLRRVVPRVTQYIKP